MPDFSLMGVHEGEIREYTLSEYTARGCVLLGVYVFDFSPVCTSQLCEIRDMDWYTYKTDLSVFGICTDGPYSHMEYAEQEDISYPLLSDTGGEVLEQLGVLYDEKDGLRNVPKRSLFLIDSDRTVVYRWVAEDNWDEQTFGVNPVEQAIARI